MKDRQTQTDSETMTNTESQTVSQDYHSYFFIFFSLPLSSGRVSHFRFCSRLRLRLRVRLSQSAQRPESFREIHRRYFVRVFLVVAAGDVPDAAARPILPVCLLLRSQRFLLGLLLLLRSDPVPFGVGIDDRNHRRSHRFFDPQSGRNAERTFAANNGRIQRAEEEVSEKILLMRNLKNSLLLNLFSMF